MTANRLLSIALLAKAVVSMAGQESRSSDLISGYAMSLPLIVGDSYCFPSLSLLSKYWQDPSGNHQFNCLKCKRQFQQLFSEISLFERRYWSVQAGYCIISRLLGSIL